MAKFYANTTLFTIAKLSGLSISSVSRVMNAPHLTSRNTQQKVNNAIRSLDIEPKKIFRHKMDDSISKKILVIDNQLTPHSQINQGIEQEIQQQGYQLIYLRFFYFSQDELHQIIKLITCHPISGILIINRAPYLKKLLSYHHLLPPIILVNQLEFKFPCVYFDHLTIGYKATQFLIAQGHKRIAIALNHSEKQSSYHLETGYQQALNRYNIPINNAYILNDCSTHAVRQSELRRLLSLEKKPTVIICEDNIGSNCQDELSQKTDLAPPSEIYRSSNLLLDNAIAVCLDMGISISKDISLFAISHAKHYPVHHYLNRFNSVYKPLYKMGQEAVSLLLAILNDKPHMCRSVLVESELLSQQQRQQM